MCPGLKPNSFLIEKKRTLITFFMEKNIRELYYMEGFSKRNTFGTLE